MNFRTGLGIALLCLSFVAGPCQAGFDEGLAAANKGDFATALKEWRPLALRGDASVQFNLGLMYANGQGVPQDDREAVKWYRLAAGQGHADAQHNLGVMYATGQGVPQDEREALKWYRLAANQGQADAQNNLGLMCELGLGMMRNRVLAYVFYKLSAANDPSAANKATANRARVLESMSNKEIEAAQQLSREMAQPGNLLKALDRYVNKPGTKEAVGKR